jgi:hypothetical protein
MGGLLPTFVTAGTVEQNIAAEDPEWNNLQAAMAGCAGSRFAGADVGAFEADLAGWISFKAAGVGFLTAAASQDELEQVWTPKLAAWQARFKAVGCAVAGPQVAGQGGPSDISGTIKVVAIAAALVAAAYLYASVGGGSRRRRAYA